MAAIWDMVDYDAHESVHFFEDAASGLRAIIALHSTHLGAGAGGTRFWHYADKNAALTDALRLSRGMSYKNAMAGLPLGGGKAVLLADANRTKTPEMLRAFGKAIESLSGQYVTAEDVGMTVADMVAISKETRHVSGLPLTDISKAGGDPGPYTSYGVFLGIQAAAKHRFGAETLDGLHIAIQGVGSVGGGVARLAALEGARLSIADMDSERAQTIAAETGATVISLDEILALKADILSPNALGAQLNADTIPNLNVAIVAGGANNQMASAQDSHRVFARDILYAPDYVINAGGIINVGLEYLGNASVDDVNTRIENIPQRLDDIWVQSASEKLPPSIIADHMAQRLIGRTPN